MEVLSEKELIKLDKKGKVLSKDGKRLKFDPSPEERQAKALEKIALEIAKALQIKEKNAVILLETIRKIKTEPIKFSEPVKKWRLSVLRDNRDFIKEIIAKEA